MITLELNKIRDKSIKSSCEKKEWLHLLQSLSKTKIENTTISFSYIAETNNIHYALWCLRCVDVRKHSKKITLLCADMAESVLPIYKKDHPNDKRVEECIKAIRDFAEGEISKKDLLNNRQDAYAASYSYANRDDECLCYDYDASCDCCVARKNSSAAPSAASAAYYAASYAVDVACPSAVHDVALRAFNAADAADVGGSLERKKQVEFIKKYLS